MTKITSEVVIRTFFGYEDKGGYIKLGNLRLSDVVDQTMKEA